MLISTTAKTGKLRGISTLWFAACPRRAPLVLAAIQWRHD
jgi:hypothetical protein